MRWKLPTILGYFLALASIADASAEDKNLCTSSRTEIEILECFESKLKDADAELNSAYKLLMTRYKENGAPSVSTVETQNVYLKKAQLAWIKQRDTTCDFETYDSIAGSGFGSIYTACLLKQTQNRVDYLKWYIRNP
jgi:uncharacterized protein YecT (DUF1311 family)